MVTYPSVPSTEQKSQTRPGEFRIPHYADGDRCARARFNQHTGRTATRTEGYCPCNGRNRKSSENCSRHRQNRPGVSEEELRGFSQDKLKTIRAGRRRRRACDLVVRREQVFFDNVDNLVPTHSFNALASATLPKGTLTVLPPHQKFLPRVAFSFGEAFHTNDPRIGTPGQSIAALPTVIIPSHGLQLVISKEIADTDFSATLARVSNAMELAKIDPDTGLQESIGPSLTRSVTLAARRRFTFASLQGSWARATAIDRLSDQDVPEAPRLIWDVEGTLNRLPFGLIARGEYEVVGRKPLGEGFTAMPVREFRLALLHSFRDGQMDLGLNSLIARGYTGQTVEFVQAPGQSGPVEKIVGVPLKPSISMSWSYNFHSTQSPLK